jgi:phosphate butyryltransferase
MFADFTEIVNGAKALTTKSIMAVAAAEDKPVLESVLKAKADGIADAVLVGDRQKIEEILGTLGEDPEAHIIEAAAPGQAGEAAVALIRQGRANFLMKGLLDTKDLLGPVVRKESNLRTGRVMSHLAFYKLPNYPKLIVSTDGGMILYPTLEEKKSIIENAAGALRALGYPLPKIAVLAGVEKVNPKMQETVDAYSLAQMNRNGEITGCVVDGPLSYDVAMSAEIARHKGVEGLHSGDYDVLVVPSLATGNILGKSWSVTAGAIMAGMIVGAKVPIVLTSRGATAEEKYLSIALASLTVAGMDAVR